MKYLKQRDLFLKGLNTGLIKYTEDDIKSINEVLQNDIAWGDSLLGRLINSIIRKAKVGVNLVRMESVSKSIYSLFDSLVSDSVISEMENPSKIKLIRFAMIMMIADLEKSAADEGDMVLNSDVEMAENVSEIKKITDRIIAGGEKDIDRIIEKSKGELTEDEISLLIKDKDKLMGALKAFRESLNEIEPDESKSDKEVVDSKKESSDTSTMVKNFTSLYKILFYYNEMKSTKIKPEVTKKQDIAEKDLKDTQRVKQSVEEKKPVVESINEQISTELDRVLKPVHSYFKQYFSFSKKESERKSEFYNLIGNESNKAPLLKIYGLIRKKASIKENSSLTNMFTKPEAIADKIYALYQITKTKESGDFEGVDNLMKSEIAIFNSTMNEILKPKKVDTEKVDTEKVEDKKESRIHRYDRFINEEAEEKAGWYSKVNEFWRNVFLKKFDDIEKYNLTQEQIDELSKKAESISKNSKFVKISGQDPIIEIVRLFNRAYNIHTVNVIPSGRSDGRVSNKTFREYQYVGSGGGGGGRPAHAGTVEPGMGPYRNVALFSKWENTILDILSSSKYRVIFDKSTTIKVGDSEPKDGFGPKLKNFMNDMLYGDKQQYGTNQHDFVNKYFGLGGEDIKQHQLEMPNTGDSAENAKVSANVKTMVLEFKDVDVVNVKMGQVIRIIYIDDKNNEKSAYGYVYSDKPGKFYMKFGINTEFFRKYLPSNVNISNNLNQKSEDIFLVKLRDGKLKKGVDYTFADSLNISKYTNDKTVEKKTMRIKPTKISILRDGDDDYIIEKPRGFSKKDSSNKWIDIYNGGVSESKGGTNVESDALKALVKLGYSEKNSKDAIAKAKKLGNYSDSGKLVKVAIKNM